MTEDKLYRLDPRCRWRCAPAGGLARPARGDLPLGGVFGGCGHAAAPQLQRPRGPPLPAGGAGRLDLDHPRPRQPAGALRSRASEDLVDAPPRRRLLSPHASLRSRGAHLVHDGGLEPPGHARPRDGRAPHHPGLPAPSWEQAMVLRRLMAALPVAGQSDLRHRRPGGGRAAAPRSTFRPLRDRRGPGRQVWFSQLNEHASGASTPRRSRSRSSRRPSPRRGGCASTRRGGLWIPGFSSGLVSRFDPATAASFESFGSCRSSPIGSETPYALNVDPPPITVWICGTNSDSLIRFDPEAERLHRLPAADPRDLHPGDRLRCSQGRDLDLELERCRPGRSKAARA